MMVGTSTRYHSIFKTILISKPSRCFFFLPFMTHPIIIIITTIMRYIEVKKHIHPPLPGGFMNGDLFISHLLLIYYKIYRPKYSSLQSRERKICRILALSYFLVFSTYFFLLMHCQSKSGRKPHGLKIGCYIARLIELSGYLPSFPGSTPTHKIGMTELNEILLNSTPNSWSKQAYVQGFD